MTLTVNLTNNLVSDLTKNLLGGVGTPPPPEEPETISNLIAWFKCNDSSQFVFNGASKISQWNDASGNDNHLTQVTSTNQPTYDSINKKVIFDGVNDFLSCPDIFNGVNTISGFVVIKDTSSGAVAARNGSHWKFGSPSKLSNHYGGIEAGTNGDIYDDFGSNDRKQVAFSETSVTLNKNKVYNVVVNNSSMNVYLNNSLTFATTFNTFSTIATPSIAVSFNNYFEGEMQELIFYTKNVNTTERNQLYNYLNNKYTLDS